jgi:hypothetical protein
MDDEPACARTGHKLPASVIHIEKPEKQGKVWLAFSEHAWSQDTLDDFEKDPVKRDTRMQMLMPATWVSTGGYKHGLEATQAHIEEVIEYQDNFVETQLTGDKPQNASNPDGTHIAARLQKEVTRHPLHMRKGQSKPLADVMKDIGKNPAGKDHTPLLMAVWDAVGITTELNGFRNDAAGVIEQYGKERELEITALNAIEGVKKMLADKTGEAADAMATHMNQLPMHDIDARQTRARMQYRDDPAKLKIELDKLQVERQQRVAKRGQSQARVKAHDMAHSWDKYEAKLETSGATYNTFKKNYDAFLSAADTLVDQRTEDLIAWLEFVN